MIVTATTTILYTIRDNENNCKSKEYFLINREVIKISFMKTDAKEGSTRNVGWMCIRGNYMRRRLFH